MKHLAVELKKFPRGKVDLIQLVESLLWLVPHPETITLVFDSQHHTIKVILILFSYLFISNHFFFIIIIVEWCSDLKGKSKAINYLHIFECLLCNDSTARYKLTYVTFFGLDFMAFLFFFLYVIFPCQIPVGLVIITCIPKNWLFFLVD